MLNRIRRRGLSVGIFVALLAAFVFVLIKPYALIDWLRLRGYTPPTTISSLAEQTTMTDTAKHLFFLNKPSVEDKKAFQTKCPKYDDQTITIGCYVGGQRGIYVLGVNDERLAGVEQVTAAHEMLHAAYERLSQSDRDYVDNLLRTYAENGLKNQRILTALEGYKKSEPGQELNEMHSMFGTEVADLPDALEEYYSRFFNNRQAVVGFANSYQEAFTSRQQQIDDYDSQLEQQSAVIKANTQKLDSQSTKLEDERRRLDGLRSSGDIDGYNAGVAPFNVAIGSYNDLLTTTRELVQRYNQLVETRNAIAAQKVELQSAIDSSSLPDSR
jgi:hypothetical protein